MEARDEHKNFCFEHGETGERVYHDPRFEKDVDAPNMRAWKAECLAEMRHSVYLGSALVEDWDRDAGKKNRQDILKKVLRNAKLFVRALTTSVTQARELWTPEEFAEDQELTYSAYVLRRVNEMRDAAEAMVFEHRQKKLEILNNSRRWKGLVCKSCKHTCTDQAATHCPTCGVRLDSRVTIALRSGEPSPFASKPPSGKATPAAGQESEIPNFKGSYLGRLPLVSADFWTSDHLWERFRSVDAFPGTRARGTLTLKRT